MKRTLFLAVALGMLPAGTQAAVTYTQDVFATAFTDKVNNVVYNGNGYFAVQSGISTKVELTINLTDLYNYVQNHDYLESYMIEWDCNDYNYGLADTRTAGTSSTTTYTPTITGWVSPDKWTNKGSIAYNVLQNYTDASNNITFTITNNNSGSLTESSILNMQGCLAMGSEVALASTTQINMTGAMAEQLRKGVEVQLFSGIDKLLLDGQEVTGNTITMANISIDGEAAAPFEMTFNNGVLSLSIPEPTTATLSLLALAGLAARRRRTE